MANKINLATYANPRVFAVMMLSFASGLPFALTYSTLQAWYTDAGISLLAIGSITLVTWPYLFKFLWAPLMDRFVPGRWGRRRSWIVLTQGLLTGGLIVMAMLSPKTHPWWLAFVAFLVTFSSASQDIAIDAYRVDVLNPDERGMGAAVTSIAYRCAMLVSGALALVLAQEIGWRVAYFIMAAIMFGEIVFTLFAPNPVQEPKPPINLRQAVVDPFREFLTRNNAILILVFILIYKICDAFALSLNTPFLIRDLGFSLLEVGSITKVVGITATLLGSFVGGILLPRMGLYRALMVFGFLQMASNLLFALLAVVGKNYALMAVSIFGENFCGGLSTIVFVAFLMGLCDKRFTAFQYALFSALMSVGRIIAGPPSALMVAHLGWAHFYVWTFFMGLPALVLLWWLRHRVDFSAETIAQGVS